MNFIGHSGREEHSLAFLWELLDDTFYIINKSHIEHTVCLVEYKDAGLTQIHVAKFDMADEASWSCDDDVCAKFEGADFLLISSKIGSNPGLLFIGCYSPAEMW